MLVRELNEANESRILGPFAVRSSESRGRRRSENLCPVRSCFERDSGRILFSLAFRRLRQKTQVFFSPRNDHICTRMEHVIYVSYISKTIGRALGLNTDLIEAIALGHDLGHGPFGHSGERELDTCLQEAGQDLRFRHEAHSLRVVDLLAERRPGVYGLNLSFEVRDGIVSHCGERYGEYELTPRRNKTEAELQHSAEQHTAPATLEGCVVRFADRIAYVGRDIEDAARSGLMSFQDLPKAIASELGSSNSDIINTLVTDLIEQSRGQDRIAFSRERAESMEALLHENVLRIYQSEKVRRYEMIAREIVRGLFAAFIAVMDDPERLADLDDPAMKAFSGYLAQHPDKKTSPARRVCDYIAGMSDHFATETFKALYQI